MRSSKLDSKPILTLALYNILYNNGGMKKVRWLGSSREDLISFPKSARADIGYGIERLQNGLEPLDWKPLLPGGIFEIRVRDRFGIYRAVYLLKISDEVVIVHCFKKKTQKTSKKDLDLIQKRVKELKNV
jgi:phage-related protein